MNGPHKGGSYIREKDTDDLTVVFQPRQPGDPSETKPAAPAKPGKKKDTSDGA